MTCPKDRTPVSTDRAPGAVGPYSQAIIGGGLVFCSGQIALDAETGAMAADDVAGQTTKAVENLAAVLDAAGSSLAQVVKTTVFITNMDDFAAVNEAYARFFPGDAPPARACVEVSRLPKNALVEIEAVALTASS